MMEIILREFRQEDLLPINRWANNPAVTEQVIDAEIFSEPHSLEMTQGFLDSCFIEDDFQKIFVVADSMSEEYLGQVRLYDLEHSSHSCSVDIVLADPSLWGKHAGKKALELLLQFDISMKRFNAEIPLGNNRAISLFRKCGFKEIEENNCCLLVSFVKSEVQKCS